MKSIYMACEVLEGHWLKSVPQTTSGVRYAGALISVTAVRSISKPRLIDETGSESSFISSFGKSPPDIAGVLHRWQSEKWWGAPEKVRHLSGRLTSLQ